MKQPIIAKSSSANSTIRCRMLQSSTRLPRSARVHANYLTGNNSTADVEDIRHSAENFAIALWGRLYTQSRKPCWRPRPGSILSNHQPAGDPWPSVWYAVQLFLRLVTPGDPTRSETKLRGEVAKVVEGNICKLESYERNNRDAPLKAIRNLSVMTGGQRTGPLSKFASEFTNLNLFGLLLTGHYQIGASH